MPIFMSDVCTIKSFVVIVYSCRNASFVSLCVFFQEISKLISLKFFLFDTVMTYENIMNIF